MAAIFAKGLGYFVIISSFCMQMPGIIQPTGLTAVYGSTSDRLWISPKLALSVISLTEPWEAPGWQVIATDADVKQVIASWLHSKSVFTLEYKPWYHCGANAEMVVVTTFRSDVYRLLHMCHVLIKVTVTFRHESVCYLISWKFLYIRGAVNKFPDWWRKTQKTYLRQ